MRRCRGGVSKREFFIRVTWRSRSHFQQSNCAFTGGCEPVTATTRADDLETAQLVESLINGLRRASRETDEVTGGGKASALDLLMKQDQKLFSAVLVEVPIGDLESAVGEFVAESAVIRAPQLEDVPDAELCPISLITHLNEVNNGGNLLKCGVTTNGFHGGAATAIGVM